MGFQEKTATKRNYWQQYKKRDLKKRYSKPEAKLFENKKL